MAETTKKAAAKTAEKKSAAVKKTAAMSAEEKSAAAAKLAAGKNYSTEGASGKRIGAIICWVVAVAAELVAAMNLTGKWYLPAHFAGLKDDPKLYIIIFLVVDLIFLIIGSLLWKKANHIDPPSEKNKLKFYLQSELGVIMALVCFVPFLIYLLMQKDKNSDFKLTGKESKLVLIIALAALVLGGLVSADFNPISEEEKTAAIAELNGEAIYVTPYGHCYHYYEECQSLTRSTPLLVTEQDWYLNDEISSSAIESAINKGYTKECAFCAREAAEAAAAE